MSHSAYLNYNDLKVLIIDDETDICYLLSTLLKQKNLDAEYVNTLSDAALALKKETPEIIFLDNQIRTKTILPKVMYGFFMYKS